MREWINYCNHELRQCTICFISCSVSLYVPTWLMLESKRGLMKVILARMSWLIVLKKAEFYSERAREEPQLVIVVPRTCRTTITTCGHIAWGRHGRPRQPSIAWKSPWLKISRPDSSRRGVLVKTCDYDLRSFLAEGVNGTTKMISFQLHLFSLSSSLASNSRRHNLQWLIIDNCCS